MAASSPATLTQCAETRTCAPAEARVRAERDQVTQVLRALASELDELDRRLSDIAWRLTAQRAQPVPGGIDRERTVLEIHRDRLNSRLRSLADRLKEIDVALSGATVAPWQSVHVGTCPDCGYPSLGSGLCASCRLYLVR